jgi:hypothetical protein
MIRTLILFLTSFVFVSAAFAAASVKTPDNIRFEIQGTSLGGSNSIKYILIDFVLSNESDTKKINFDHRFDFILSDEFGNRYRTLPRPENYNSHLEKVPFNFPSIYPGEGCAKALFFEAPIAKATRLKLEIRGPFEGTEDPLELEFPAPGAGPEGPSMIEIASPENGDVMIASAVFSLHVRVNSNELPFKIIIVAFGKTLEDGEPSKDNTYNVTIPGDTPQGPASISVIGYWTDPKNGSQQMISENIIIHVNPGPPASL